MTRAWHVVEAQREVAVGSQVAELLHEAVQLALAVRVPTRVCEFTRPLTLKFIAQFITKFTFFTSFLERFEF